MKEVVERIAKKLESVVDKKCCADKSKFSSIPESNPKKIVFVDGGQAEILKAVDFSLQFIRVVGVVYLDNKKVENHVKEFFVLITSSLKDGMVQYNTEMFPVKGETIDEISLDSFDSSITVGKERGSVSQIGNIVRRFSELKLAADIAKDLDEGFVVLDGCLKSLVKGEKKYLDNLYESAGDVIVSGLAKTSSRFFNNGNSVLDEVDMIGEDNTWKYELGTENDYSVFAVKLYPRSNYVFEFNVKGDADSVLSNLVSNSKDPVFLGYPYGLIVADRVARVSNNEKDHLLFMFKAKLGKRWKDIEQSLHTQDSHNILDNIS